MTRSLVLARTRAHRRTVAATLLALTSVTSARAQTAGPAATHAAATLAPVNPAFPLPDGLVPQVGFWKTVYAHTSTDEVLFHDRNRLDVIYAKRRIPEATTAAGEIANENLFKAERARYAAVLRALGEGFDPDTLTGEAQRIHALFGPRATPGTFSEAAENVRGQRGLRERFIEGIAGSGRYHAYVEQVFREEGVPLELTYLPFVESMYNLRAYSSVGAAGIWQFMPGTARLFMRVDGVVDERMDPIRAARSAARLLRQNYQKLGTWPLAITAYNHGPYGVANAVRTLGTRDIERIVKLYDGRGFGFASRNFYTEFLAALHVRQNYQQYFGDVRMDPPLEFDEVVLPVAARLTKIAQLLEVPVESIWEINPAFTANARRRDQPLPAGYRLRLPEPADGEDDWDDVIVALRSEPAPRVLPEAPPRSGGRSVHVVRAGETLGGIAERYDTSVARLRQLNGLGSRSIIHPGQRLRIAR